MPVLARCKQRSRIWTCGCPGLHAIMVKNKTTCNKGGLQTQEVEVQSCFVTQVKVNLFFRQTLKRSMEELIMSLSKGRHRGKTFIHSHTDTHRYTHTHTHSPAHVAAVPSGSSFWLALRKPWLHWFQCRQSITLYCAIP